MSTLPAKAKGFILAVSVSSLAIFVAAMLKWNNTHDFPRFMAYLVVASIAARFTVSLPKMKGTMSVNMPFILVALMELSLPEALLVAGVSTFVQCFWPESKNRSAVKMVFNVSVLVIAARLTWEAMHAASYHAALAIVLGTCSVLIANTLPVAAIIGMTENKSVMKTWTQILQLTFPYYLLAGGIASIVKLAGYAVGWQVPLFILPAMFLVYRSYSAYFRQLGEVAVLPTPAAMGTSAGS